MEFPKLSVYFDEVPTLYCALAVMANTAAINVIIIFFIILSAFLIVTILVYLFAFLLAFRASSA
jgi:hypothetical protein